MDKLPKSIDLTRLLRADDRCYEQLKPYRKKREKLLRSMLGRNYNDSGQKQANPLNLMGMAYAVFLHALTGGQPMISVRTKQRLLRPHAATFREAMNLVLREINMRVAIRECVAGALFGKSMAKVYRTTQGYEHIDDLRGTPCVEYVDLDKLCFDTTAKCRKDVSFIRDEYSVRFDDLKDEDVYDQDVVRQLSPNSERNVLADGSEPISALSFDQASNEEYYAATTDVKDIWLERERILITVASKRKDLPPLRWVEWDSKDKCHGPYHEIDFLDVPGNLMPIPPASGWYDLHHQANAMFRKVLDQALRQKDIGLVLGNPKEGERIIKAVDGDVLQASPGGDFKKMSLGGPNQQLLAMSLACKDIFSYFAGGLDLAAGLDQGADTLGQSQIMQRNSTAQMRALQRREQEFLEGVVRDLGWFVWDDPDRVYTVHKQIPGVDVSVPSQFGPDRMGEFYEYDLEIVPYTEQSRSPAERLQEIMLMMDRVGPVVAASGRMEVDPRAFVSLVAELSGYYEMKELMVDKSMGGMPVSATDQESVAKPGGQTHSVYERVNRTPSRPMSANQAVLGMMRKQDSEPVGAVA